MSGMDVLNLVESRYKRSQAQPRSRVVMGVVSGLRESVQVAGRGSSAGEVVMAATLALERAADERKLDDNADTKTNSGEERRKGMLNALLVVMGEAVRAARAEEEAGDGEELREGWKEMWGLVTKSLIGISEQSDVAEDAGLAKSLLKCITSVIERGNNNVSVSEGGADDREGLAQVVVEMCIDPRPKVRKEAAAAVSQAHVSTAGAARRTVTAAADTVLERATAAQQSRGSAGAKAADVALAESVLVLLHALSALKGAPLLGPLAPVASKLYALEHPLIAQHVTDALMLSLTVGPVSTTTKITWGDEHKDQKLLVRLTKTVMPPPIGPDGLADADTVISRLRCTEAALLQLCSVDRNEEARDAALRAAISSIVPLLGCKQEGVRFAAADTLQRMISGSQIATCGALCMKSMCASVASLLTLRYRDGWHLALPVLASLVEAAGRAKRGGDHNLVPLLQQVEIMRKNEELRDNVDTTLGIAIRWMGVDTVLEALPLELEESISSGAAGRAWLLPLIRANAQAGSLEYWATSIFPMTQRLRSLARNLKGARAQLALAAEVQAWSTLPAFCKWAIDTSTFFPNIAKEVGSGIAERQELRSILCSSLVIILKQNLAILKSSNNNKLDGHESDDDDKFSDDEGHGEDSDNEDEVPEFMNEEIARENLDAIKQYSRNFLPILFNAFVATAPGKRQHIASAIAHFARVCDAALLRGFFRTIMKKLIEASKNEEANDDKTEQCTYIDLILALLNGLQAEEAELVYTAARAILAGDQGTADIPIQKRGYRLIVRLVDLQPDMMAGKIDDVVEVLAASRDSCGTAAQRYRLLCVRRILVQLLDIGMSRRDDDTDFGPVIQSFISETILGLKEHNARTRSLAFEQIDILGRAYEARGSFEEFFNVALAGLAGATPHMISAAVMSLARLLSGFSHLMEEKLDNLVKAIMLLMRSKAREIIRSVLDFVKIVTSRVSVDKIVEHLDIIIAGLLLWCEDTKNKFKLRVRVILERLVKRCGYDTVAHHIPEEHSKLISHIRKMMGRAQKKRSNNNTADEDYEDMETLADGTETLGGRTGATSNANSAKRSHWHESEMLIGDDAGQTIAGKTSKTRKTNRTNISARSKRLQDGGFGLPSDIKGGSGDPLDLLGVNATGKVLNVQGGRKGKSGGDDEDVMYAEDGDGKLIIAKELKSRKRQRGLDEEDVDARSLGSAMTGKSGRSKGGRSAGVASKKSAGSGKTQTGERYRSKKGAGDRKISGAPDPYSYWSLDRKLLNRRTQKRREAKSGLGSVVNAVKKGAAASKSKRRKM